MFIYRFVYMVLITCALIYIPYERGVPFVTDYLTLI